MKKLLDKIRQIPAGFAMVCHFIALFIPSFIFWGSINKKAVEAYSPYYLTGDDTMIFVAFFAAITAGMILPVVAILRQVLRHHLFGEENW